MIIHLPHGLEKVSAVLGKHVFHLRLSVNVVVKVNWEMFMKSSVDFYGLLSLICSALNLLITVYLSVLGKKLI